MTFFDSEIYKIISIIQIFVMIGLYFLTAYRGPYAHMEVGEKIGRSIFLSLSIIVMVTVAQFISILIATSYTVAPAVRAHIGA